MLQFAVPIVAASMVMVQVGDLSAKGHLKALKPIIGNWSCDGVLQEDVPAIGKKGDRLVVSSSHRWILGKSAIQLDWTTEVNGKEVDRGRALIAWDAITSSIMEWAVITNGNHNGPWTHEGNTLTYSLRGINRAGKVESKVVYSNFKPESFTFQIKDRKLNGDEMDDSAEYQFKRVDKARRIHKRGAGSDK